MQVKKEVKWVMAQDLLKIVPIVLSVGLFGCISTTQDKHININGKCITCVKNPVSGKPINYEEGPLTTTSQSSETGDKDCGIPKSKYDDVYHRADKRWCSNLTLPGAKWSNEIKHSELVKQGVDMAYINAKQLLQFLDADDEIPQSTYNISRAKIDAIPSTYYSIASRYGGPAMQLDWLVEYQLELKRVSKTTTRVTNTYKIYSKDMNPTEFQQKIIQAINGS